MTIGLMFFSLLVAAIVGWLMRQTLVEPWRAEVVLPEVRVGLAAKPNAKVALWVFLGVASSLFVLFASAYAMRLSLTDWSPLPRPRWLLVNTAFLLGASLAMEWTVHAARRADNGQVRRGLAASGLLSFAFLAGQLYVWKQFHDAGFLLACELCATYWHYLLAVWVLLYALLVSQDLGLAICSATPL
jgi:cytochrome c oxidase subunit 3